MKGEMEQVKSAAPMERKDYVEAFRHHALSALDEAGRAAQERDARNAGLPAKVRQNPRAYQNRKPL